MLVLVLGFFWRCISFPLPIHEIIQKLFDEVAVEHEKDESWAAQKQVEGESCSTNVRL